MTAPPSSDRASRPVNEEERAALVRAARAWIGTPYRDNACRRGPRGGVDCLQLLAGVREEALGIPSPAFPVYTKGWREHKAMDPGISEAVDGRAIRIARASAEFGDVALFRIARRGPIKHCGFLTGEDTLVHAYSRNAVREDHLSRFWRSRMVAVVRLLV